MNNDGKKKYVEDSDFSSEKSESNRFSNKGSRSSRTVAKKNTAVSEQKKKPSADKASRSNQKTVNDIIHKKTNSEKKDGKFSTHGTAAFVIIIIILFLIVTSFSAVLSYTYFVDRFENPISVEEMEINEYNRVEFRVEKGATTAQIADALKEMGLIENKFVYKIMSRFNGYDGEYKSGIHYLREGLSIDEIMVVLSQEPETVKITFPEGFTTLQIAERLDANEVCSKEDFLSQINSIDYSSYQFMPAEKGEMDYIVDGYLFPDTYLFEIHSSVETVVYKMLNRFNDVFLPEYYERIEKMNLTVNDVVTLASFVEKEAKLQSERETIARVYYNRLMSDDLKLMQCDATVLYFLKKTGDYSGVLNPEDRKIEDRYNTYLHEGLTPGAICSPSKNSIESVITMNPHNYYYYTLKKDGGGTHVFSETLEEHKKAQEENKVDE